MSVLQKGNNMTDGTLQQVSVSDRVLYMAMELSASSWVLSFSDGSARPSRRKRVDAAALAMLDSEIAAAKEHFGLGVGAAVVSCYEAGRDGFWIHRALTERGVTNHVVESSSIEVSRRSRRAKTDSLDVESLLRLLIRWHRGERNCCRMVRVPNEADEDARRLPRERERLKKEVTQLRNRIHGLLATQGLKADPLVLDTFLPKATTPDGRPVGSSLKSELLRMHARLTLLYEQLATIEKEQLQMLRARGDSSRVDKIAQLMCLCGIGVQGAWILVAEFFGWRAFRNRRQVGALAGLTGTPFNSGGSERDQGISKAGNKRIRRLAVELAWLWIRHQPESALTKWFAARWGSQAKRAKKVGVVALARKLLVALWHFIEHGAVPDGAKLRASRGLRARDIAKLRAEACHGARSSARIESAKACAAPGLLQPATP